MFFKKYVLFTILLSTQLFSIDFQQLTYLLEENSKQLEFKKYDINISKEDLNIIKAEDYPSVSLGFNIENAKSLEDSSTASYVGDNSLVTNSLKKSYSSISLNYNLYSFGRLDNKKKAQEYQINSTKYEYCLEQKNLIINLLEIYNNSLNYQIKMENLKEITEIKSIIYKYKEKLFKTGNIIISIKN